MIESCRLKQYSRTHDYNIFYHSTKISIHPKGGKTHKCKLQNKQRHTMPESCYMSSYPKPSNFIVKNLPSFPSLHSMFLLLLLCLPPPSHPFSFSLSLKNSCLENDRRCFKFFLWPIYHIKESVFDDMKTEQTNIFWLFADSFPSRKRIDLSVTYHFSHAFKGSDSQERKKSRRIKEERVCMCVCLRSWFC